MSNPMFGMEVIVDPRLPTYPSDAENARRIVRHGMADILRWLRQSVGPAPGEGVECLVMVDTVVRPNGVLFVSRDLYHDLRMGMDPYGHPVDSKGRDAIDKVWRARDDRLARWSW